MNLYLTEQGSYVKKNGNLIEIKRQADTICSLPGCEIESVMIFGAVQISIQAMLYLLEKGCQISFFTEKAHYRGTLVPSLGKNIVLRLKQYELFNSSGMRLLICKEIVQKKILCCKDVMCKYYYKKKITNFVEYSQSVDSILKYAQDSNSIEVLRGYEGAAAKLYWKKWGECLKYQIFSGRKYFPSPDPVNALLSLGYSLLGRELQGLLEGKQLDPYLGFFHSIEYGRASLALDLLEPFRSQIIDCLTLSILNKKILEEDDFERDNRGGYKLNRQSLKIYLSFYEDYLRRIRRSTEGDYSYRKKLYETVEEYKKRIESISLVKQ